MIEYLDVADLSELPAPPEDLRFLDFMGEPKGYRCFLVSTYMPRGEFLERHEDLLDERLKPIYQNAGITVRQDSTYPIPGFYIVHPKTCERSLDEMEEVDHLRTAFIIREIRRGMREVLGIEHIHMYYEEKRRRAYDIHYWLLPIYNYDIRQHHIGQLPLRSYLNSFKFAEEKEKILTFNNRLKSYLADTNLLARDNQLREILQQQFS